MYASADPFHQEFVPPANVLRVVRATREIFGARNYCGQAPTAEQAAEFAAIASDPARRRDFVRQRWLVMMVGSAQRELAADAVTYAPDDPRLPQPARRDGRPADGTCADKFRAASLWELHLDPSGNLQTNCGVLLGNVRDTTPAAVLQRGPETAHRFAATLAAGGARGLARLAHDECGFAPPARVTSACELCYLARRCLRAKYPAVFGPAEIYA